MKQFYKNFIICLMILSGSNLTSFAQGGKGKISGKVVDAASSAPVDYATISVYKQGAASPFNGISTDKKGNFSVNNLPEGTYKVTVDFLGYQRQTIDKVVVKNGGASLGTIKLAASQTALKGVTVTANAPIVENKIDKMVYNTANDLTAQGGVAIDVLKKVPQISVDIDGNVELQGSPSIRFLINGKPSSIFGSSLADALQSIPASQIKSIEVITSPGAKYDASGTGGIINIVLKDNKMQGMNGSVNLSAGTRLENGSVNLNVRKNSFGAGMFFSGNEQLNTRSYTDNNRRSVNKSQDTVTTLMQSGYGGFKRQGYESGLNFQWDITKYDNLTGAVGMDHFSNSGDGLINQQQQMLSPSGALFNNLLSLRNSASNSGSTSTDWSLDYKKTFKKDGRELELLYTSSYGKHSSYAMQQQNYLNGGNPSQGAISNNPGNEHETQLSLDYTDPFSDNFILETGAKVTFESLSNNVITDTLLNSGSYINNSFQTYGFNYSRNVYAAYLSGTFKLFNFFDGKAGLRYERTNTTAGFQGVNIPDYSTWAPSFVLSHKLDKTQAIKFAYTYRIERPDYGDLNPFYNISDPHNISSGNPYLKPEIGHNYELGYNKSFKDGSNFMASAFYRSNTDDIQAFSTFYSTLNIGGTPYSNVTLTQRDNIGKQTGVGLNLFGSVPAGKFVFRSNVQLGERTNSSPSLPSVTGFAYRVNLNASYQFPADLLAEVFGNYNSNQKNLQGTRPGFGFYNIAMRKQFMNKKASIGLTAANPFAQYVSQTATTSGTNFTQANLRQVPYRSFGITLSYKFGKLEFKNKDENNNNNNNQQVLPPDNGR
ncbi:outer membrane receptor for ferrienterochelin and colicin [Mucilaginibacter yixingensis]|uniref:Outer membrane receptor for ferrienterochelin and colicin n=2 Tax=Mucilaginibacter yixingensis TaxID=1295612 RepID=A0A2T5JAH2_9SPHI|nr:outer membrane receptor for ferrienterochelin and colicin [Mucilaginibacter yixingensis]